jgi:hypothetical protein
MILQVIAIALIVAFPVIATKFPEQMRAESAAVKTEEVDDSMNRLESDPLKGAQDEAAGKTGKEEGEAEEAEEDLEKDPLSKKK